MSMRDGTSGTQSSSSMEALIPQANTLLIWVGVPMLMNQNANIMRLTVANSPKRRHPLRCQQHIKDMLHGWSGRAGVEGVWATQGFVTVNHWTHRLRAKSAKQGPTTTSNMPGSCQDTSMNAICPAMENQRCRCKLRHLLGWGRMCAWIPMLATVRRSRGAPGRLSRSRATGLPP
jgi:hypothetical protein